MKSYSVRLNGYKLSYFLKIIYEKLFRKVKKLQIKLFFKKVKNSYT